MAKNVTRSSSDKWNDLSPGLKLEHLVKLSLDRKLEILQTPLPSDAYVDQDSNTLRRIILAAADSTIAQVLQIHTGVLNKPPADDISAIFEERRRKAIEAIEKLEDDQ